MKIGVVSDTHSQELPEQMLNDFKNVDFILHAGDICSQETLAILEKIKEVKGVAGNMDNSLIRRRFEKIQIIEVEKFAIGLVHGEGPPNGLLDIVRKKFKDKKVDAIVYGHSHNPLNEVIDGVLMFNPGSPNDLVFAPYRSYGILTVAQTITGEIIKVK